MVASRSVNLFQSDCDLSFSRAGHLVSKVVSFFCTHKIERRREKKRERLWNGEEKKNISDKKNNGCPGRTNGSPTSRHASTSSSIGPVRSQIFDELSTKKPLDVDLRLAAGRRESPSFVAQQSRWRDVRRLCFRLIIVDVHSRGSSNLFAGVVSGFSKPGFCVCLCFSRVSQSSLFLVLFTSLIFSYCYSSPLQCYAGTCQPNDEDV